jgi:YihY family inner membrane protein
VALTDRLDDFQQRHRWAGFPVAVVYKYADDQGGYLAALITYYGFLSIFPLLLLASSALGFVLQGNDRLRQQILDSALSQFPVIGDQLADPGGLRGSGVALVVAVLGSVYGALGVAQATQNAMNVAWAVPRNKRPNPFLGRLRSLVLLGTAGVAILATTVLSAAGGALGEDLLGDLLSLLAILLSVAVNTAVFALAYRLATTHPVSLRDAVPGALAAAVAWQLLQTVGVAYVGHVVRDASATNGVFAIVLGLIAWVYVAATVLVLGAELNVVRAKRLWPRALMTPFTDDVDLTRGDRATYTDAATAQRTKEFEDVDVSFEHDGQYASARRRETAPGPSGDAED